MLHDFLPCHQDLTFKLEDIYVTVISLRNSMFIDKEGTHPAHIGIVQIQHRKLIQIFWELSEKN